MNKKYIIFSLITFFTLTICCSSHKQVKVSSASDQSLSNPEDTTITKGVMGIGYGAGYGNRTGAKDIDAFIESIFDTTQKSDTTISIKEKGFAKGGSLKGKRSRKNILKIVFINLAAFRYAYNQRLKEKPDLKGRVTYKILIIETGSVIDCSIVSSTIKDRKFERILLNKIKKWDFGVIDAPSDTTEVIYPFVFLVDKNKI